MNAFELTEWMISNRTCICGGTLKEISENGLKCDKCGLTISFVGVDKIEEA